MLLIGDGRKHLAALLTLKVKMDLETGDTHDSLNEEGLLAAREAGLLGQDATEAKASELMASKRLLDHIQKKVDLLNEKHVPSRVAAIKKWKVLPGDFSLKGGHLAARARGFDRGRCRGRG